MLDDWLEIPSLTAANANTNKDKQEEVPLK